ncbi:MAG: hypothetical protein ACI8PQ_002802, partial [Planctomycetota bacterium]
MPVMPVMPVNRTEGHRASSLDVGVTFPSAVVPASNTFGDSGGE